MRRGWRRSSGGKANIYKYFFYLRRWAKLNHTPPHTAVTAATPALAPPRQIIFSTHGRISLAAAMAGGDYDGDEFLVIPTPEARRGDRVIWGLDRPGRVSEHMGIRNTWGL